METSNIRIHTQIGGFNEDIETTSHIILNFKKEKYGFKDRVFLLHDYQWTWDILVEIIQVKGTKKYQKEEMFVAHNYETI